MTVFEALWFCGVDHGITQQSVSDDACASHELLRHRRRCDHTAVSAGNNAQVAKGNDGKTLDDGGNVPCWSNMVGPLKTTAVSTDERI